MFAAEQSALVIDAYQTLSKPLLRAIYLVSFVAVLFILYVASMLNLLLLVI